MRPEETFVGQPVRSLQQMLRLIGEDRGQAISVIPDGIYGQQTRGAVANFQREQGLPITGVADSRTHRRVSQEYDQAYTRVAPAEPLQLILNPNQTLTEGEEHPYLYLVQVMLQALSAAYRSIPAPAATGVLDSDTAQALADFQYLSGLSQTGQLDKITWKHLALQYPLAVNIAQSQNRRNF